MTDHPSAAPGTTAAGQDQRISPERETEIRKRLIFGLHGLPYRRIETVMLDEALQELDATRTLLAQARDQHDDDRRMLRLAINAQKDRAEQAEASLAQAQADVAALTAALDGSRLVDEDGQCVTCWTYVGDENPEPHAPRCLVAAIQVILAAFHQHQAGASPAGAPPQAAGEGAVSRKIVTLVGRRRDWRALRQAERLETMAGNVVLTVGCIGADGATRGEDDHDEAMARQCIALHFDKIRMSDEVLHASEDGTIGQHTQADLDFAVSLGKPIRQFMTATVSPYDQPQATGDESDGGE